MLLRVPSSSAIVSVVAAFALTAHASRVSAHDSCCHSSSGEPSSHQPLSALFLSKATEACPWLLIGLLTTAALEHAKFPFDLVRSLLVGQQRSGSSGTHPPSYISSVAACLLAALAGLATPLCSCGALPLAISLSAAGAPPHAVVAFLTAAQSAGLDSAAITFGLLGPRVAAFRLLGSVVLAVAAGAAVGTTTQGPGEVTANEASSSSSSVCCDEDSRNCKDDPSCGASAPGKTTSAPLLTGPLRFCRSLAALFDEVWVMLAGGILVTALVESNWTAGHGAPLPLGLLPLQSHVHAPNAAASSRPEAWDEEEDGPWEAATEAEATGLITSRTDDWRSDLLLRAAVIVAALPLQLCEHGVVSFASALLKAGVSPGTAQAFLLSAPATNVTTLGVLLKRAGGAGSALRSASAIAAAAPPPLLRCRPLVRGARQQCYW